MSQRCGCGGAVVGCANYGRSAASADRRLSAADRGPAPPPPQRSGAIRRAGGQGQSALIALARKGHDLYARTMHTKTNLIIDINGDTATMRAHDVAVFALDNEKEAISAAIQQYTARRTNTGWRINTLTITPVALSAPLTRAL
jgi:hypothetical protein